MYLLFKHPVAVFVFKVQKKVKVMTGLFTHRLVMSKTSFVEGFFAFSHGATAKKLLFVPKKKVKMIIFHL